MQSAIRLFVHVHTMRYFAQITPNIGLILCFSFKFTILWSFKVVQFKSSDNSNKFRLWTLSQRSRPVPLVLLPTCPLIQMILSIVIVEYYFFCLLVREYIVDMPIVVDIWLYCDWNVTGFEHFKSVTAYKSDVYLSDIGESLMQS